METSKLFQIAFARVMENEGQYSNHPQDPGGETYRGISRVNFPDWEGWKLIDKMKDASGKLDLHQAMNHKGLGSMVEFFYHESFWLALGLDEIGGPVAVELFDMAVNIGIGQACRIFQEALNLLNNQGKHYPNILVDGKMGKNTKAAWDGYMSTARLNGRSQLICQQVFVKVLNALQAERYIKICRANESQEVWFFGWMKTRA